MTKYLLIEWPEIQDYMDHPRYNECYSSLDVTGCDINGVWFVPEDLVEELRCKDDSEFIFNGQIFTRNFLEINRNDLICFSNDKNETWTSYCIISGKGYMPDIYEHGECPGINCYIEGVKI